MDPRDVIYYTEHRIEHFRRQREHAQLVRLAKLNPSRPSARVFRIFPFRRRESETTTD